MEASVSFELWSTGLYASHSEFTRQKPNDRISFDNDLRTLFEDTKKKKNQPYLPAY